MMIKEVRAMAPEATWTQAGPDKAQCEWGYLELRADGRYHAEPWHDLAAQYRHLAGAVGHLRAAWEGWQAIEDDATPRLRSLGWTDIKAYRCEFEAKHGEAHMIVRPLQTTMWTGCPKGLRLRGSTWREVLREYAGELRERADELRARAAEIDGVCDEDQ
jgi:hypothetical protein